MHDAIALSVPTQVASTDGRRPGDGMKTWHLYAAILVITLVVDWFQRDYVMTRSTQMALFADVLSPEQLEQRWLMLDRTVGWSVLLTPVMLALYIGFFALVLQLGLVLIGLEHRFRVMYRVAAIAQVVITARMVTEVWYRWRLPLEGIDAESFYRSLGTLSDLVPVAGALPTAVVELLGLVTLFELAWYAVLFLGLTRSASVSARSAGTVVVGLFLLFNTLQWAVLAYLTKAFG